MDFANKHLPKYSNIAFQINELNGKDNFIEHTNRLKNFIKTNGSKSMTNPKNLLSDLSNAKLIGTIFTISSIVFGIGFYFGTEKTNNELIRTENELIKLKDSLSSIKTFNNTKGMSNEKEKVTKSENNNN